MLIAGLTVVVSLLGLQLSTLQTYATIGYATAICVACVMLAALTLVPALCALAGHAASCRAATAAAGSGAASPRAGTAARPVPSLA